MAKKKTTTGKEPEAATAAAPPPKKKTTRKKRPKSLERLPDKTGGFLEAVMADCRTEYGDPNICCAGEAGRIVIGVPIPLAFQYLTQNSVFPLSRMIQIVGTEGTCKSALCFEIVRWFHQAGGYGTLFENETKYSPEYANSIIGWPETSGGEILGHIPCASVDEWQERLQFNADRWRTVMAGKDGQSGPGRIFPVALILDSIMGKLAEESQEKIEKAGAAGRSFPVEALMINNFLKKFPQDIEEWPMSFIAVNHLKPQKAEGGFHTERHKAGGRSISFQETWELEMKRNKNAKVSLVGSGDVFEVGGLNLKIACKKNSLGETDRIIPATILWQKQPCPVTNRMRQVTRWDWPAATVDIIQAYDKGKRKEMIQEVVDVHPVTGQKYWSDKLNIPKSEALPKHDFGVALEKDKKVVRKLQDLFGITRRKAFQPGVDYLDQLAEVEKKIAEEINGTA